jgi:hypothetical protein
VLPTGIPELPGKGFKPFETDVDPELTSVLGGAWLLLAFGSRAVREAISSGVKTPGNPAMLANCACDSIGPLLTFDGVSFLPGEGIIPVCGCWL